MQISSIRFWLFQLRTSGLCRNPRLRQFRENILCRSIQFEADPKVLALRDKLLYCDYLDLKNVIAKQQEYKNRLKENFQSVKKVDYEKVAEQSVFSVALGNQTKQRGETDCARTGVEEDDHDTNGDAEERKPLHMPYAMVDSYQVIDDSGQESTKDLNTDLLNTKYKDLYEKYLEMRKNRLSGESSIDAEQFENYMSNGNAPLGELWKIPYDWMCDYEQFDDTLIDVDWYKYYGTPDVNSEVSCIPCGGCGALMHCKDPAIPGYLPSELFLHKSNEDLKSMICQRCHFLKFYNAALEVKVSIDDYPNLLSVIKRKKCAIILIVDLTDFPCSIWPGLRGIMHPFTPIFLVGNKIDLLPRDSPDFFDHIKQLLVDTVVDVTNVKRENITHVQLVSAKTGYGIEELINKLQYKWRHKGDVYLIGCTNVGKSSLFNVLLNSDYCKVQAIDLVQRATVSGWPGTTLNLLKFPILNPTEKKIRLRIQRLRKEQFYRRELLKYRDYQFSRTGNMKFATLEDHVGRTYSGNSLKDEESDPFSEKSHKFMLRKPVLDESSPEYEHSRWCYDTPGTIQRDQILDLLTTDELLLTLPQQIISPRTFIMRPSETMFVAGMGRLDYLEGEYFIRCTLFTSNQLPVTMCYTADADEVYDRLLETEAFVVPKNDPERLKVWPRLESKEMKVTGLRAVSAADVVLSSAGWVAITAQKNDNALLRAWTPQARGIYLRSPALLTKSVHLSGPRIQGTPMYSLGKQVKIKC
ncbi:nitric oxide-associated protein 1 [Xylocopa sonorina]|uniref:nitric oxide-associated protein 1 n=1 Tax=Xylocopa sonorina TaxID=1818115 RepID=UPI00403B1654